jgi:uncharacterized protein (TIGR02246 family)
MNSVSQRLYLVYFLAFFLFSGNIAIAKDVSSPTKEEISQLFNRWNASLQTGKPDDVAKNYAADGILIPTVSNKVRHNHAEIADYFVHFLELKPKGKIDEQNIRIFGDIAIDSGLYTFDVIKEGKPTEVKGRYTFVYKKINGKWLIIEHHSSMLPEKTPATH